MKLFISWVDTADDEKGFIVYKGVDVSLTTKSEIARLQYLNNSWVLSGSANSLYLESESVGPPSTIGDRFEISYDEPSDSGVAYFAVASISQTDIEYIDPNYAPVSIDFDSLESPSLVTVAVSPIKPASITVDNSPSDVNTVELARDPVAPAETTSKSSPIDVADVTLASTPVKPATTTLVNTPEKVDSVVVSRDPVAPAETTSKSSPIDVANVTLSSTPVKPATTIIANSPISVDSLVVVNEPKKPATVDAFIPFVVTIMENEAKILARASTTPTGTIAFGTDTKNLYVYNTSGDGSWGSFNADDIQYTDALPNNVLQTEHFNFIMDEQLSNYLELEE